MARSGRPRLSSRRMLEDAAHELFLENTYHKTTVDHIAQRAGVGRNTFFNYFSSKSDVLWLDVDDMIELLPEALRAAEPGPISYRTLDALVAVAAEFPVSRVPWSVTQRELLDITDELASSGVFRMLRATGHILASVGTSGRRPTIHETAFSYAIVSAAFVAGTVWATAGVSRRPLETYMRESCTPIAESFLRYLEREPD